MCTDSALSLGMGIAAVKIRDRGRVLLVHVPLVPSLSKARSDDLRETSMR